MARRTIKLPPTQQTEAPTTISPEQKAPPELATAGAAETTETEVVRPVTESDLLTLSEHQRNGVNAGHIRASWDKVTISAQAGKTAKDTVGAYIRLEALNTQGLSLLFDGKINPETPKPEKGEDTRTPEEKQRGACDYANYGYDLERRASIRQKLMATLEGPEKAVKNAVKGMLGLEMEPAEIKDRIINSPKFKGTPGLDKLVDAALRA